MKNIFYIIALFFSSHLLQAQKLIEQPYFFMSTEEASAIVQKGDSLKIMNGFIPIKEDIFSQYKGKNKYRIIETIDLKMGYYAFKLKRDASSYPSNPYLNEKQDKMDLLILKLEKGSLFMLIFKVGLDTEELNQMDLESLDYRNAFGFEFYSLEKLKGFNEYKRLETVSDYLNFEDELEKAMPQFAPLAADYQKNFKGLDMYASGFTGMLLSTFAIQSQINPLYIGRIGHIATDDRLTEEEKNEEIKRLYDLIDSF